MKMGYFRLIPVLHMNRLVGMFVGFSLLLGTLYYFIGSPADIRSFQGSLTSKRLQEHLQVQTSSKDTYTYTYTDGIGVENTILLPIVEGKCFIGDRNTDINSTMLVSDMQLDPCYRDRKKFVGRGKISARACSCSAKDRTYSSKVSYAIPPLPDDAKPLTERELADRAIFAFIHLNKAGGTTIKRDVLFKAAVRNKWDAAAFGSYRSWDGLGDFWPLRSKLNLEMNMNKIDREYVTGNDDTGNKNQNTDPEPGFIGCGKYKRDKNLERPYDKMHSCSFRALWGAMTLGLCQHFPKRPCIYFIFLRDPIARAISSYNYVCIQGAEHRKKWLPEWKKEGHCPLTLLEFFGDFSMKHHNSNNENNIGSQGDLAQLQPTIDTSNKLVERLSRGCDSSCGLQVALQNLRHPCLRFMFLDDFKDGLEKMLNHFGSAMSHEIGALLNSSHHRNKSPYSGTVINQINNPEIMSRLKKILAQDIKLYSEAKKLYAKQWAKPLMSCNQGY